MVTATDHRGCNVCDADLANQLERGGYISPPISKDKSHFIFRDTELIDYTCPACSSRARMRTFALIMKTAANFRINDRDALVVSANKQERTLLKQSNYEVSHVSFEGDHGDPACQVGIDIGNMPTVPTNAFDLAIAINVLDYIPTLSSVFGEFRRVLRAGGMFLFFIQPQRLREGCGPPKIKHLNALAHEKYAQKNGETGVPDCEFGVDWILAAADAKGLQAKVISIHDPLTRIPYRWFVAVPRRTDDAPLQV